MRKSLVSFLAVLLITSPLRLLAWGGEGHRTVGLIAEKRLSRKAKKEIRQLLGTATLADVASWADEVRNTPEYKHTAPWHFVNQPMGLDYAAYTLQLKAKTEQNAYQALNDNLRLLADRQQPREKRLDALRFVVHIVGDVHQPMHVSRAEDKGGNDIKLRYHDHDSNLHRVWDSELIKQQAQTPDQMARAGRPRRRDARQWRQASIEQWLFESYQLSAKLYADAQPGSELKDPYYAANIPTVQLRLQQGGVRLAEVLNKALK